MQLSHRSQRLDDSQESVSGAVPENNPIPPTPVGGDGEAAGIVGRKWGEMIMLTTSQNLNPLSTSALGYLIPVKVSSQISKAMFLASLIPDPFGSLTLCPPLMWVRASRYTLARIPNPVLTSVWKGNERVMSNRSSRARRTSPRNSMLSVVTSRSVRRERESDRMNELKTSSSLESGADHACDYGFRNQVRRYVR